MMTHVAGDATNQEVKRAFRKEALMARRALSIEDRNAYSDRIRKTILSMPEVQAAKSIFAFVSMPDEVQTMPLFAAWIAAGKSVSVPHVFGANHMEAVHLSSVEALETGAYGILTVRDVECLITAPDEIDLVLVPGVAFSTQGVRLGMGGGYYDPYLLRVSHATRIAVVYACQIYAEVPYAPHDAWVDAIVTERGITPCDRMTGEACYGN